MELVMESVPLHNLVSWYNSAMLCRKLYSETSRTKEFAPVKLEFPFFFFFGVVPLPNLHLSINSFVIYDQVEQRGYLVIFYEATVYVNMAVLYYN